MARQRMLKPEFFTDEGLSACTMAARLLFAGLWTLADKAGRLKDQPPVIHGALFPYERSVDVDALLAELERGGFIVRYEVEGRRYIEVRNFARHQNPHPKEAESLIPPPGSAVKSNGSAVESVVPSRAESESESNTESVSKSVSVPPLLPAVQRSEDDNGEALLRQSRVAKEREFYALVSRLAKRLPEIDPPEIARTITSYTNKQGAQVGGVIRPETLTDSRLDKSLEDARGWLEDIGGTSDAA